MEPLCQSEYVNLKANLQGETIDRTRTHMLPFKAALTHKAPCQAEPVRYRT